jgi:hypothetical protein
MFIMLHDDTNAAGFNLGNAGESHMMDANFNTEFEMTTASLTRNAFGSGTIDGRYYIFGIDIEQDFEAPVLQSGDSTEVDPDANNYGIRVSKEGKSVFSEDLRDFTIHSGTRSPLIHSVDVGTYTTSATVTITHNLGVVPFPMLYWEFNANPGKWVHLSSRAAASTTTTVSFTNNAGATGDRYSLVILKEPLTIN